MPTPVSAFIITKNEEVRLPGTIAALQPWVDEILVVDSGSTDRTVDIARSMGANVLHRDWTGYGPQKRFAEQSCRNDWVLNVDADEVITPALATEIRDLFSDEPSPDPAAYKIKILTVYPGEEKPRPLAKDYNVVRLYDRRVANYRDHPVYDRVTSRADITKQLVHPIFHYPYISFEHLIDKNNRFSSFRSMTSKTDRKQVLPIRVVFEFPITFIKYYFFRRHFTGGWKGFYFALCHAFMRTSRIAKMLERAHSPGTMKQRTGFLKNSPYRHPSQI